MAGQADRVEHDADAAADGGEDDGERDRDPRPRAQHVVEQGVRGGVVVLLVALEALALEHHLRQLLHHLHRLARRRQPRVEPRRHRVELGAHLGGGGPRRAQRLDALLVEPHEQQRTVLDVRRRLARRRRVGAPHELVPLGAHRRLVQPEQRVLRLLLARVGEAQHLVEHLHPEVEQQRPRDLAGARVALLEAAQQAHDARVLDVAPREVGAPARRRRHRLVWVPPPSRVAPSPHVVVARDGLQPVAGAPYRAELRWGTLRKNCEDELVWQGRQTVHRIRHWNSRGNFVVRVLLSTTAIGHVRVRGVS